MDPLGDRKMSELKVQMLRIYPPCLGKDGVLSFFFLQHLLRELRALIRENFSDHRDLTAREDHVWVMHFHKHWAVASIRLEGPVPIPVA
jgi:hypothetical protein